MTTLDAAWVEAEARDRDLAVAQRKARGVVHTPPALARFTVRVALGLVEQEFGAERPLVALDPALGTGIFPAALLDAWRPSRPLTILGFDVDEAALRRADDVLRAPALALGVSMSLAPANALERSPTLVEPGVRLVLGNPPWAGKSASRGAAATDDLLDDFKRDHAGAPLGERKLGVLSDDYVRFLRWSLELLRTAPEGGVVAMVTNASWLDGPVHRGMRAALLAWLDVLVLVELGGSSLVSRARGVRDENVFGVRPGVVVILGVRRAGGLEPRQATVRHVRVEGSRHEKFALLEHATLESLAPRDLTPRPPHFALVPRRDVPGGYARAPSIAEWMPFHREGVQTNRDAFAVDTDGQRLRARLDAFATGTLDAAEMPAESAHFEVAAARAALSPPLSHSLSPSINRIAYRPLDTRFVASSPAVCHRPRPALREAIARSEFALVTTRKDRGGQPFRHFAVTTDVPDNCFLSARSSCRARAFPTHDPAGEPNIGASVAAHLTARGATSPPGTVAAYIAAFVGAPSYQHAFDEVLRTDFPRIPLPATAHEFAAIATAGEALIAAWLAPFEFLARLSGGPEAARTNALVIGHHRVIERLERERPDTLAGARTCASAIVRAELFCDLGIAESLARLRV